MICLGPKTQNRAWVTQFMAQATSNPGWCNLAQNRRTTLSNNPVPGRLRQPQMPGNMANLAYFLTCSISDVRFKTCGHRRVGGSAWVNPAKRSYLPPMKSAFMPDQTGGTGLDRCQRWSLLVKVTICQSRHLSELLSGQRDKPPPGWRTQDAA